MTAKLLNFNAFGLIRVNRDKITTSITAVEQGGHSINRVITEDMETEITAIEPDEFTSFLFAATILPGKKAKVAIREIGELTSHADVENTPQVRKAIEHALNYVRKSAGITVTTP